MDLLVRATLPPDRDAGAVFAAGLAGRLRAGLTALHVVPAGLPPVWEADGGLMLAAYATAVEEESRVARAAGPAFEAWAGSLGAIRAHWLVAPGQVGEVLRYVGNWHDLLVLARDPGDAWGTLPALAALILGCDLPCVLVPGGGAEPRGDCIAVAWNGSVEAIRALHGALPLLQRARRIVLLAGHRRTVLPPVPLPAFDLESWCRQHGLEVEFEVLDESADRGAPILEAARAARADLLVLGAYGRSRFSERVLGGVTRYMLEHADLPLLLRH